MWLALYLARRITTPLRLVAEGAERIAAGHRGVRIDFPSSSEEPRVLIASFNRMSERLARTEEEVEFGRAGLMRKNQELEERRRLTETVLETVGTGVLVVDDEGTVSAVNAAAHRLLDLETGATGLPVDRVLKGAGRDEIRGQAEALLALLDPLFEEPTMEGAKGVGWGFKTLGRGYPDLVGAWLDAREAEGRRPARAVVLKKARAFLSGPGPGPGPGSGASG